MGTTKDDQATRKWFLTTSLSRLVWQGGDRLINMQLTFWSSVGMARQFSSIYDQVYSKARDRTDSCVCVCVFSFLFSPFILSITSMIALNPRWI